MKFPTAAGWAPERTTIFQYVNKTTGENICFNVTTLERDKSVQTAEVVSVPIEPDFAYYIIGNHGLEKHRLDRLMRREIPEGGFEPVLYVKLLDRSCLLIEGNHRYVAAHLMGHKFIRAKIVLRAVWKKHLATGLPRQTAATNQARFSGIR